MSEVGDKLIEQLKKDNQNTGKDNLLSWGGLFRGVYRSVAGYDPTKDPQVRSRAAQFLKELKTATPDQLAAIDLNEVHKRYNGFFDPQLLAEQYPGILRDKPMPLELLPYTYNGKLIQKEIDETGKQMFTDAVRKRLEEVEGKGFWARVKSGFIQGSLADTKIDEISIAKKVAENIKAKYPGSEITPEMVVLYGSSAKAGRVFSEAAVHEVSFGTYKTLSERAKEEFQHNNLSDLVTGQVGQEIITPEDVHPMAAMAGEMVGMVPAFAVSEAAVAKGGAALIGSVSSKAARLMEPGSAAARWLMGLPKLGEKTVEAPRMMGALGKLFRGVGPGTKIATGKLAVDAARDVASSVVYDVAHSIGSGDTDKIKIGEVARNAGQFVVMGSAFRAFGAANRYRKTTNFATRVKEQMDYLAKETNIPLANKPVSFWRERMANADMNSFLLYGNRAYRGLKLFEGGVRENAAADILQKTFSKLTDEEASLLGIDKKILAEKGSMSPEHIRNYFEQIRREGRVPADLIKSRPFQETSQEEIFGKTLRDEGPSGERPYRAHNISPVDERLNDAVRGTAAEDFNLPKSPGINPENVTPQEPVAAGLNKEFFAREQAQGGEVTRKKLGETMPGIPISKEEADVYDEIFKAAEEGRPLGPMSVDDVRKNMLIKLGAWKNIVPIEPEAKLNIPEVHPDVIDKVMDKPGSTISKLADIETEALGTFNMRNAVKNIQHSESIGATKEVITTKSGKKILATKRGGAASARAIAPVIAFDYDRDEDGNLKLTINKTRAVLAAAVVGGTMITKVNSWQELAKIGDIGALGAAKMWQIGKMGESHIAKWWDSMVETLGKRGIDVTSLPKEEVTKGFKKSSDRMSTMIGNMIKKVDKNTVFIQQTMGDISKKAAANPDVFVTDVSKGLITGDIRKSFTTPELVEHLFAEGKKNFPNSNWYDVETGFKSFLIKAIRSGSVELASENAIRNSPKLMQEINSLVDNSEKEANLLIKLIARSSAQADGKKAMLQGLQAYEAFKLDVPLETYTPYTKWFSKNGPSSTLTGLQLILDRGMPTIPTPGGTEAAKTTFFGEALAGRAPHLPVVDRHIREALGAVPLNVQPISGIQRKPFNIMGEMIRLTAEKLGYDPAFVQEKVWQEMENVHRKSRSMHSDKFGGRLLSFAGSFQDMIGSDKKLTEAFDKAINIGGKPVTGAHGEPVPLHRDFNKLMAGGVGAVTGIQKDEKGNLVYDPIRGMKGAVVGLGVAGAAGFVKDAWKEYGLKLSKYNKDWVVLDRARGPLFAKDVNGQYLIKANYDPVTNEVSYPSRGMHHSMAASKGNFDRQIRFLINQKAGVVGTRALYHGDEATKFDAAYQAIEKLAGRSLGRDIKYWIPNYSDNLFANPMEIKIAERIPDDITSKISSKKIITLTGSPSRDILAGITAWRPMIKNEFLSGSRAISMFTTNQMDKFLNDLTGFKPNSVQLMSRRPQLGGWEGAHEPSYLVWAKGKYEDVRAYMSKVADQHTFTNEGKDLGRQDGVLLVDMNGKGHNIFVADLPEEVDDAFVKRLDEVLLKHGVSAPSVDLSAGNLFIVDVFGDIEKNMGKIADDLELNFSIHEGAAELIDKKDYSKYIKHWNEVVGDEQRQYGKESGRLKGQPPPANPSGFPFREGSPAKKGKVYGQLPEEKATRILTQDKASSLAKKQYLLSKRGVGLVEALPLKERLE